MNYYELSRKVKYWRKKAEDLEFKLIKSKNKIIELSEELDELRSKLKSYKKNHEKDRILIEELSEENAKLKLSLIKYKEEIKKIKKEIYDNELTPKDFEYILNIDYEDC